MTPDHPRESSERPVNGTILSLDVMRVALAVQSTEITRFQAIGMLANAWRGTDRSQLVRALDREMENLR